MFAVPAATPVTIPVDPTVATNELLLLHAPPVVVSVSVVLSPAQTLAVPPMAAGKLFTVTTVVVAQPSGNV